MYHSITIGEKNTWRDWHLIPSSRPLVNPPGVKTSMVEVPGSDGVLDLSDALIGRPNYGQRSGTWDFYVDNGYGNWAERYSDIMAYLHGQKLSAVLEDDPSFHYEGRFSVNQWRSDPYYSRIAIDYAVGPYKLYSATDGDLWEWDPFNFENDVIRSYKNMIVRKTEPLLVNVTGDIMDIIPVIYSSSAGVSMSFDDEFKFFLKRGSYTYDDVIIRQGTHEFYFTIPQDASYNSARISLIMTGGKF